MRISDWSSDVCSSDLIGRCAGEPQVGAHWPRGEAALAHIVGVAMDNYGLPIRLFTANRWVTDETWYAARDVITMLDHFEIRSRRTVPAVNGWIAGLLRLFHPEIVALVRRRHAAVDARSPAHPHG